MEAEGRPGPRDDDDDHDDDHDDDLLSRLRSKVPCLLGAQACVLPSFLAHGHPGGG